MADAPKAPEKKDEKKKALTPAEKTARAKENVVKAMKKMADALPKK